MCIIHVLRTMQIHKLSSDLIPRYYKPKIRDIKHVRVHDCDELLGIFTIGETLGNGCFGTVVKAVEKKTKVSWAVKIINKATIGTDRYRSIEREIYILKIVSHPNIIYLDRVYESPKKVYLLIEICQEELMKKFKQEKKFSEDRSRYIIKQLASAVAYLHKNQIIHRDLKLENILLADNPGSSRDNLYIKVADFGLGIIKPGMGIEDMLHDCCGTLTYMAPEMLAKSYNQQCDIWSMGIIMFLMLSGRFPFFARDEQDLIHSIKNTEPDYTKIEVGSEGIHLLSKMLVKNPALRIQACEIESHPWILNTTLSQSSPTNVLDMMHEWKAELLTPLGDECDWITFKEKKTSEQSFLDKRENHKTRRKSESVIDLQKNLTYPITIEYGHVQPNEEDYCSPIRAISEELRRITHSYQSTNCTATILSSSMSNEKRRSRCSYKSCEDFMSMSRAEKINKQLNSTNDLNL